MKAQRVFFVLATVALGALTVTGCGGDDTEPANAGGGGGGATTTTTGAGGAGGTGGTGTGTGTGGTGGTTATNPPPATLAAYCYDDSECGEGLRCATPDAIDPAFGGAIQDGYCTKDCAKDADCPNDGLCLQLVENGAKQCLASCIPGSEEGAQGFDDTKCGGREDLACTTVTGGKNACLPMCGLSGCEGDFECKQAIGLCVDPGSVGTGLADGSKCDPEAAVPECAGVCLSFAADPGEESVTTCSTPCVIGADPNEQCGGGYTNGLCAFAQEGAGIGDFGFCTPACKKQDDCQGPTFWCMNAHNQLPNGFCFGTSECSTDADCAEDELNSICTETSVGKRCLNPKYDLGSRAPGSGGGGAGGTGGAGGGNTGGAGGAATTTTGSGGAGGASTTTTTTGSGGSGGSSTTTTTGTGGAGGATTTTTGSGGSGGSGGAGGSAGAGGITTST